ncbi:unnamed protein product, partial [Amoebophrya sp. A25]
HVDNCNLVASLEANLLPNRLTKTSCFADEIEGGPGTVGTTAAVPEASTKQELKFALIVMNDGLCTCNAVDGTNMTCGGLWNNRGAQSDSTHYFDDRTDAISVSCTSTCREDTKETRIPKEAECGSPGADVDVDSCRDADDRRDCHGG